MQYSAKDHISKPFSENELSKILIITDLGEGRPDPVRAGIFVASEPGQAP